MCIISEEGRRPGLPTTAFSKGNDGEKKEKARDAARDRRAKEHEYFQELDDLLPNIQTAAEKSQDKTSLIRLAVAFLRSREVAVNGLTTVKEEADIVPEVDLLSCLDGFSLVIGAESDVIYVSTNVSSLIGLRPAELLGQTLADYIHPCDQAALASLTAPLEGGRERPAEVTLRMKCTVTERGRVVNLHQASYKPLHVSGTTRELPPSEGRPARQVFLGLAGPVGPAPLGTQQLGVFSSRHSLDMKFLEVDSCVAGHPVTSLLGESFFSLLHPGDAQHVQVAFRNLREQGLCSTQPYRLLAGGGGYCWLQTRASCAPGRRGSSRSQMIQCQHWQLTGVEERGCVMATVQLPSTAPASMITQTLPGQKKPNLVIIEPRQEARPSGLPTSVIVPLSGLPKVATNNIFTKTEEAKMAIQPSISISTNNIFGPVPEHVPLLVPKPNIEDALVVVADAVEEVKRSHEEEILDEKDFFSTILNFDLSNMDQFAPHQGEYCVNIKTKGANSPASRAPPTTSVITSSSGQGCSTILVPGLPKVATSNIFAKTNIDEPDEDKLAIQPSISISTKQIFGPVPEHVPLLAPKPLLAVEEVQRTHEEEMLDEQDIFSAILNLDLRNMDQFAPHHGDNCVNIKSKGASSPAPRAGCQGAGQEHSTVNIKEEDDKSLLESFLLSCPVLSCDTFRPSPSPFSLELPSAALLHPEADIMWGASNGVGDLLEGARPQDLVAELLAQPASDSWGMKRVHSQEHMGQKKVRVVQSGYNQFVMMAE